MHKKYRSKEFMLDIAGKIQSWLLIRNQPERKSQRKKVGSFRRQLFHRRIITKKGQFRNNDGGYLSMKCTVTDFLIILLHSTLCTVS